MFVGHSGIALIGKGVRRQLPTTMLLIAAYLPDLVRLPMLLFTNHSEELSHSIPAVIALAAILGGLWLLFGGRATDASILVLVCLLHWPADVFSGCKPILLNGPWIGMFAYIRPVTDLTVEGAVFIGGWWFARQRAFPIRLIWLAFAFVAQLTFLLANYAGSEFVIGNREWMWQPRVSLLPKPDVVNRVPCRPPPPCCPT
jgi:hypothetical protein